MDLNQATNDDVTDNHVGILPLNFYRPDALPDTYLQHQSTEGTGTWRTAVELVQYCIYMPTTAPLVPMPSLFLTQQYLTHS